jgi:hypothetical protein
MKKKDEFTEALEALKDKNLLYKVAMVKREIGTLTKKSDNPFFKSKYLELSDLLEAVEPLLDKWGLVLIQPIADNKVSSMICNVENGEECITSEIQLPNIADPQKLGSAITYFRRYTLQSLLALQAVDDDGNHSSKPKTLTDQRFSDALTALEDGKTTVEDIKKFNLTPAQAVELDEVANAIK